MEACRCSGPRAASGSTRRATTCCRLVTTCAEIAIVSSARWGRPPCPPRPVIGEREEVARGHERPRHGGDLAVLERRPQVAAVDEVDAVDDAGGDEVARAAGGELLGVLEEEAQLAAGQAVARAREQARGAEQHRGVPVVAAGVHDARASPRRSRRRSARSIGSASMSARSATSGRGGRSAGARRRCSRPGARARGRRRSPRASRRSTPRSRVSSKLSSGWRCRWRRHSTTSSSTDSTGSTASPVAASVMVGLATPPGAPPVRGLSAQATAAAGPFTGCGPRAAHSGSRCAA